MSIPTIRVFFAEEGQTDGGISCHKGLSFAGLGGREEDHPFLLAQHEQQVGTQAAEGFFHKIVLVFAHHNGSVLRSLALGQFGQNSYIG